ncbi:hypothetical protein ACEPAG_3472 [Sanghuangporus baumii]
MPLIVASDPPRKENSSSSGKGNTRTPLRPVLASITPGTSPSLSVKRTPLGEKKVTPPSTKTTDSDANVEEAKPRFPSATIEMDSIGNAMAARLVICLLGHVLFLKSQVPFPVAQLMKMSSRRTNERPNKKMDALLSSFDVLSTHLGSTFSALTLALSPCHSNSDQTSHKSRLVKTHVAIVLGPSATSMSAARARVVLELDGLRVAFRRTSVPTLNTPKGNANNERLKENAQPHISRVRETLGRPQASLIERRGLRVISHCSPMEDKSDASSENDDHDPSENPSVVEFPPDSDSESDSESSSDDDSDEEVDSSEDDEALVAPMQTEADINAAERNLSRTLAIANADPELGMAAETRPTQIHILIRAPRRFSHPAWIPGQNLTRDMDPLLREFEEPVVSMPSVGEDKAALNDITNSPTQSDKLPPKPTKPDVKRKRLGGIKTDYVRVRSRGAAESLDSARAAEADKTCSASQPDTSKATAEATDRLSDEDTENEEGNEMIWWSWDGKLEGFTEI